MSKRPRETMDSNPPDVVGPSDHAECDRCGEVEPAEVEAVFYWETGPETFHLCGTCYLEWANDSTRTPDESCRYWRGRKGDRRDRRFDD